MQVKKWRQMIMIMGDLNATVGKGREGTLMGPHGLGTRDERGDR